MNTPSEYNLVTVDIFSQIHPPLLKYYENMCMWNYYQKAEQIITQQDHSHDVYFIVKGSVEIIHYTADGKTVGLEVLEQGMHFGELAAIDNGPRSTSVIANENALLAKMSAPNFIAAMETHPSIGLKVMIAMARIIRLTNDRVVNLVTLSAYERVLLSLVKLARQHQATGNSILIKKFPIHSVVANKASTTRETVARVFSTLAKKGTIKRHGTAVEIFDIEVLEKTLKALIDKHG